MTNTKHEYIINVKYTLQGDDRIKNLILELRKQKDMTQQELADILAVSRQTVNSLETGKYNPSIALAFKISKIFDKSIEEIFIFEEE